MYIRIYFLPWIIFISLPAINNLPTCVRIYFITKDFFNGYKDEEFSIYDSTRKQLQYRIESDFAFGLKLKVVNQSTKQITAMIRRLSKGGVSRANFAIIDSSLNQYINGTIEKVFNMTDKYYLIQWHKHRVFIGNQFKAPVRIFQYENSSEILAILETLSNKLPDEIYFLAVGVILQTERHGGRG
ncbi:unnamed protein product [Adineta ricciae]|uniref:Uncharacterized protein n=1 Tax=Adineta ricciae TaxID=249248 RepID=A0A813RNA4_ADIRI|nr:unnamed protein product [Adineta ricciae]CAF1490685.1 unnamed protein product [Adineta ricciae]